MIDDLMCVARVADEVSGLVERLRETERRLEQITDGEVDTLTCRDGRMIVLQRAQDQLRLAEATRQASILDSLPAHIVLLDAQGIVTSVNKAWQRFGRENGFGWVDDGIGKDYLGICDNAHGNDAAEAKQVAAGLRAVLRREATSFTVEYPCHSPTEQRWFELTATPLAGERLDGVILVHANITERKQAKQALEELSQTTRRRERILNTNLSSITDFAYTFDRDGRFLFANQPILDLFGLPLDQVVGKGFRELGYPEELALRLQRQIREVFAGNRSVTDETAYVSPTGVAGHYEYILSPVAVNGVVECVVGSTRDVSARRQAADALRRSEFEQRQLALELGLERTRLIAAQQVAKTGSWETDLTTMAVSWSAETHRIHGTDPATFQPTHEQFLAFIHPGDRALVAGAFERSLRGSAPCSVEHRVVLADGRIKYVEENWQVYFDARGRPASATGTCHDITEKWRAETALRESDIRVQHLNRVYAVLSGINTLIVRARETGELFREACRIAVDAGGFRMAMIGLLDRATGQVNPVASCGTSDDLLAAIRERLSGPQAAESLAGQAVRERKAAVSNDAVNDPRIVFGTKFTDAGVRSMVALPLLVRDEVVGVLALYAHETDFFHEGEMKLLRELAADVAFAVDHIEKQERLNYLAYYDVLTGLANRSLFHTRVSQFMHSALTGGHKLALCLIDLERFKNFNGALGRAAGDSLLQHVAGLLTANAGEAILVARLGGDQFAAVLPELSREEDVAHHIESVLRTFQDNPFPLGDQTFQVVAKVGIAIFPGDGIDADSLFSNAEAALKKAKVAGDRYLFYTQKMTEAVAGRLTLENKLRQAIILGQFVLHYQPKVNLASGAVIGAEALIRWNDPQAGIVGPGQFIPILEETGLIHEVGKWALHQAMRDFLRWRASGLPAIRIAVNVSALQLRDKDFVAGIESVTTMESGAAAGLELEITESMIMDDIAQSIRTLDAIRKLGVRIAIDDFGTGFSSLGYLAKLPIDTLKIDRSFVSEMMESQGGLALVSTIINLAHALKLNVVAEGVETDEQSRMLRLLNCDEMQGFVFGRPVPVDVFEAAYLGAPRLAAK